MSPDPLDAFACAAEIDEDRERAATGIGERHRRAAGAVEPPLDLGDLQMRIDRRGDDDRLPLGTEGIDAAGERAESRECQRFSRLLSVTAVWSTSAARMSCS